MECVDHIKRMPGMAKGLGIPSPMPTLSTLGTMANVGNVQLLSCYGSHWGNVTEWLCCYGAVLSSHTFSPPLSSTFPPGVQDILRGL
jgi:hypothetical protein